ncbi:MAG: hypothetical protein M3317_05060 [Actinomycetota bacterium]|nr:hypothetical protein [Actinomycetota bacterium]
MSRSTEVFDRNRALLFSIAHRMTGSVWRPRRRCSRPTCRRARGYKVTIVRRAGRL